MPVARQLPQNCYAVWKTSRRHRGRILLSVGSPAALPHRSISSEKPDWRHQAMTTGAGLTERCAAMRLRSQNLTCGAVVF